MRIKTEELEYEHGGCPGFRTDGENNITRRKTQKKKHLKFLHPLGGGSFLRRKNPLKLEEAPYPSINLRITKASKEVTE